MIGRLVLTAMQIAAMIAMPVVYSAIVKDFVAIVRECLPGGADD